MFWLSISRRFSSIKQWQTNTALNVGENSIRFSSSAFPSQVTSNFFGVSYTKNEWQLFLLFFFETTGKDEKADKLGEKHLFAEIGFLWVSKHQLKCLRQKIRSFWFWNFYEEKYIFWLPKWNLWWTFVFFVELYQFSVLWLKRNNYLLVEFFLPLLKIVVVTRLFTKQMDYKLTESYEL